ncbi:MAG TPA: iron-containing alcohol dehydrogenase [Ignavibacteria bacterium]
MDNFVFYNPTQVVFGKNTIQKIGKLLTAHNIKKVLMVMGGGSIKKNGVYDEVVNSLKSNGIKFIEFPGVRPNPVLSHAREGIKLARENEVEAILAVGGGSVIDESKAIAAGFYIDDIWTAFENKFQIENALPLFTVLTLSATGTEMNPFAVLTNEEEKKKWAIYGPALFPVISIIDPSKQMTLPWRQTVNGAVDALSHIMEYYFMGNNEEVTLSINEALMNTIIKVTDKLKNDPDDYDSRSELDWAATLALNGLSGVALKGGDWATHGIEHAISALHPEVAHAEGLAIIFPAWIEYNKELNPGIFKRWAKNVWNSDSVDSAIQKMKEKYSEWGAPISLSQVGITENEIEELANIALLGEGLGVLRELNKQDVISILKIAL